MADETVMEAVDTETYLRRIFVDDPNVRDHIDSSHVGDVLYTVIAMRDAIRGEDVAQRALGDIATRDEKAQKILVGLGLPPLPRGEVYDQRRLLDQIYVMHLRSDLEPGAFTRGHAGAPAVTTGESGRRTAAGMAELGLFVAGEGVGGLAARGLGMAERTGLLRGVGRNVLKIAGGTAGGTVAETVVEPAILGEEIDLSAERVTAAVERQLGGAVVARGLGGAVSYLGTGGPVGRPHAKLVPAEKQIVRTSRMEIDQEASENLRRKMAELGVSGEFETIVQRPGQAITEIVAGPETAVELKRQALASFRREPGARPISKVPGYPAPPSGGSPLPTALADDPGAIGATVAIVNSMWNAGILRSTEMELAGQARQEASTAILDRMKLLEPELARRPEKAGHFLSTVLTARRQAVQKAAHEEYELIPQTIKLAPVGHIRKALEEMGNKWDDHVAWSDSVNYLTSGFGLARKDALGVGLEAALTRPEDVAAARDAAAQLVRPRQSYRTALADQLKAAGRWGMSAKALAGGVDKQSPPAFKAFRGALVRHADAVDQELAAQRAWSLDPANAVLEAELRTATGNVSTTGALLERANANLEVLGEQLASAARHAPGKGIVYEHRWTLLRKSQEATRDAGEALAAARDRFAITSELPDDASVGEVTRVISAAKAARRKLRRSGTVSDGRYGTLGTILGNLEDALYGRGPFAENAGRIDVGALEQMVRASERWGWMRRYVGTDMIDEVIREYSQNPSLWQALAADSERYPTEVLRQIAATSGRQWQTQVRPALEGGFLLSHARPYPTSTMAVAEIDFAKAYESFSAMPAERRAMLFGGERGVEEMGQSLARWTALTRLAPTGAGRWAWWQSAPLVNAGFSILGYGPMANDPATAFAVPAIMFAIPAGMAKLVTNPRFRRAMLGLEGKEIGTRPWAIAARGVAEAVGYDLGQILIDPRAGGIGPADPTPEPGAQPEDPAITEARTRAMEIYEAALAALPAQEGAVASPAPFVRQDLIDRYAKPTTTPAPAP